MSLIVITLMALAGCGEAAPDFYAQAEIAQVTIDHATVQARATQDYQAELDRRATLQAAATKQASQDEIAAIEAEIAGTQSAVNSIQTVAAITVDAERRATQAALAATVQSITATVVSATQVSIVKQASLENDRANLHVIMVDVVYPLFALTVLAFSIWIVVAAFAKRMLIQPTPMGVVSLVGNKATMIPYDTTWSDVDDSDSLASDALAIVKASIKAGPGHGQYGTQVVGWRKVPDMSSSRWQVVIASMAQAGLVRTEPQKGTFVEGDHNLQWLEWQLQSGGVTLTPPPK